MAQAQAGRDKRREDGGAAKGEIEQVLRVTPADHVRMLADLLQPATPDLARRWLAALLMVPEAERAAIVKAVEAKIVEQFGRVDASGISGETELSVDLKLGDEVGTSGKRTLRGHDAGARGSRRGTDAREVESSGRPVESDGDVDAARSAAEASGESSKQRRKARRANGEDDAGLVEVVHPPVQKAGYIEQVITTYEKMDGPRIGAKESEKKRKKGA